MSEAPTPTPPPLRVISAPHAIALARRWTRIAAGYQLAMPFAIGAAVTWGATRGIGLAAVGVGASVWLAASIVVIGLSVRSRRYAIDAAPLIASGDFGAAEDRLSQSLSSFSVMRSSKLLGLQQLALLRHAQSRWAESAALARELLARQRGRRERQLETSGRLVLAESLVALGDLPAASDELRALASAPLDLRETLLFTTIRLDWLARAQGSAAMLANLPATLSLIELLPPPLVGRAHALLAWAAWRENDPRCAMLSRRARLLGDVETIVNERPFLRDALLGA